MFSSRRSSMPIVGLLFTVGILQLQTWVCSSAYYGGRGDYRMPENSKISAIYAELHSKYANLELPRLVPKKVGETFRIELDDGRVVIAESLSKRPPIFEIKDFLLPSECDHLVELARTIGLEESSTLDEGEEADLERLLQINDFTLWDKDKNGFIDLSEIGWIFMQLFDFDPAEEKTRNMLKDLKADADDDGQLSKKEFEDLNLNKSAHGFIKLISKLKEEDPTTKGRFSEQTFLGDEMHPLLSRLRQRLASLTGLPRDLVDSSEELQVVKYKPGGHYNCHLDSEEIPRVMPKCCHLPEAGDPSKGLCTLCRYMTVLYFLNNVEDGGETAFPLADNETLSHEEWTEDAEGLCNLARNCKKSRVIARPEKGKAILWYNHHRRKKSGWLGQVDYRSFHGGCNVWKGEKWIANNWINVSPFREEDLRLWATSRAEGISRGHGGIHETGYTSSPTKRGETKNGDVPRAHDFGSSNTQENRKLVSEDKDVDVVLEGTIGKQSQKTMHLDHGEL